MLAYLALGIPPAGHLRRLDTQTITVTGGSFDPPYYTFDGGAPPTLVLGTTYEFETSGVSASACRPFGIIAYLPSRAAYLELDGSRNVVSGWPDKPFTVVEGTTYEYLCWGLYEVAVRITGIGSAADD